MRAETNDILKSRAITKKRSIVDWVKLVRAIIKAKMTQRKARREGRRARIGDLRHRGSSRNGLLAVAEDEPHLDGGGGSKPGGKTGARVTIAA